MKTDTNNLALAHAAEVDHQQAVGGEVVGKGMVETLVEGARRLMTKERRQPSKGEIWRLDLQSRSRLLKKR